MLYAAWCKCTCKYVATGLQGLCIPICSYCDPFPSQLAWLRIRVVLLTAMARLCQWPCPPRSVRTHYYHSDIVYLYLLAIFGTTLNGGLHIHSCMSMFIAANPVLEHHRPCIIRIRVLTCNLQYTV